MRCLAVAAIAAILLLEWAQAASMASAVVRDPELGVVAASRFDLSPPLHEIRESRATEDMIRAPVAFEKFRPAVKSETDQTDRYSTAGKTAMPAFGIRTNISTDFDGLSNRDNQTVNGGSLAPPSPDLDVSGEHIVQVVNLALAVYDKSGNLLFGPVKNNFIFAGFGGDCENSNAGYPQVLYDEDADRWLVSHVSFGSGSSGTHCIAVSQTDNPTGSWYRYQFDISNTAINDWPMIGVGDDAYYSAYNMFSPSFLGAIAAAFERDALIAGDPGAGLILFGPNPDRTSLMPFDIDGGFPAADIPGYFAEIPFASTDVIRVYEMNVDWGTPANSTFGETATLLPSTYDFNLCPGGECIPQPNGQNLTAISDRIMPRLQFREFPSHYSMVFNHTVDADGNGTAGVRWYELRDQGKDGTWTLYQQGTQAPADGLSRWMGSIAMDANGNIALGYTASSSTQAPSIRYTARTAFSPLGQMSFPEEIIASGVSQSGTARWGDYSTMATDADSFWFTHEYGTSALSTFNWATRIAQIVFDPDDVTPPDAITDLSASASFSAMPTGATVELSWTAPADDAGDNASGAVISYDIRSSSIGPITSAAAFEAALPVGAPSASPPGTLEAYKVSGLDFDSQHWFAVRASDDNGNASLSNSPNFVIGPAPSLSMNPASPSAALDPNQLGSITFNIANTGPAGSRLEFSFPDFVPESDGIRSQGGPDDFGYSWIDSNEPGGPTFDWIDISTSGIPLGLGDDDGVFVSLPFVFPFYGEPKTQLGISSNGYLTFEDGDATPSDFSNDAIPNENAPNDLIAVYWDDLDPGNSGGGGGEIYYRNMGDGRFIVQYEAVPHFPDADGEISSFQAILHDSGAITLQYLSMTDDASGPNGHTIGIENADASDGLEVAFDAAYIEDNLAVEFMFRPQFIVDVVPAAGLVESGSNLGVTVTLDSAGLEFGLYENQLLLETNDTSIAQMPVRIPISLMVGLFADGFEASE